MLKATGAGPKRCKCGYRIIVIVLAGGYFGGEQDELGGVPLRYCPGCLALLSADELLSEAEYRDVTRLDDWESPGSCARNVELCGYEDVKGLVADGPCERGDDVSFATSRDSSGRPSLPVSISQKQRRVWLGEF